MFDVLLEVEATFKGHFVHKVGHQVSQQHSRFG